MHFLRPAFRACGAWCASEDKLAGQFAQILHILAVLLLFVVSRAFSVIWRSLLKCLPVTVGLSVSPFTVVSFLLYIF